MRNYKFILIAFLIGVIAFSFIKYVDLLKEKRALLNQVEQLGTQVNVLEGKNADLSQRLQEKEQLLEKIKQENASIKDKLTETKQQLSKLDQEFKHLQKAMEDLKPQIAALQEQRDSLNERITQVVQERDNLNARLNSLEELKKAIRELKIRIRQERIEAKRRARAERIRAKAEAKTESRTEMQESTQDNGGFLIKNKESTHPADNVKIEVIPAPKD